LSINDEVSLSKITDISYGALTFDTMERKKLHKIEMTPWN